LEAAQFLVNQPFNHYFLKDYYDDMSGIKERRKKKLKPEGDDGGKK
jgi:hypothetical protein